MKLSDFDYQLPPELIAQYPLAERDSCRLLVVDRSSESIVHRSFREFPEMLSFGDLVVMNDSRVLSCRLEARRATGARVQILLVRMRSPGVFEALIKPARLKVGETVMVGGLECVRTGLNEVSFPNASASEVYARGCMPLPPYIKRLPEERDEHLYQTVYAREDGSIASPTAGLHFTPGILQSLEQNGVRSAFVTLHVGTATFKPVTSERVEDHEMTPERFSIPPSTAEAVNRTIENKKRVCAVGTTSCRALETWALTGKTGGETTLFMYPGFAFRHTHSLLTNFHLPQTTLFMLVCAFAGENLMREAYRQAIERKYRFYSYGDAMLIL